MTVTTPPRLPMPDHDTWPVFSLPWDDTSSGPTDMSWLLEKPAGATGFVQVVDGHLARGDGRRWRIWGQNLTFGSALAPTDMTPTIVRRLARYGLNCVRLHHMDRQWPRGLLRRTAYPETDRRYRSTRALDPEAMARLDWFIACCKEQGIYIDLNLNVSRQFSAADGVKDAALIGFGKGLTYFDERLIALQKEYAQQLLEHVNPFTGLRYADEPAIAIVELVNENSLLEYWVRGCLVGEGVEANRGTWGDIPASYACDLDHLWNDWLAQRYTDREALQSAWEGDLLEHESPMLRSVRRLSPDQFAAASASRFGDEATFYADLEQQFYRGMAEYIRGELGAKQLMVGTSDHNHRWSGMPLVENTTLLDIIDGHVYWQHPRFPNTPWSPTDWYITNTPMVSDPDHSTVAQLSRSAVEGVPYIVSEVNEPFPHDYACECIPILAAYALLQDWDGLFWFDYGGGSSAEQWTDGAISSFFSMANDPPKMAQTAAGALMFLRGDVRAASQTVSRSMPHDWVLQSLRMPMADDWHPYWYPHLPGRLALVHRTAIADFHAEALEPTEGRVDLPEGTTITSDTGELSWITGSQQARAIIDSPRTQAIVGYGGHSGTRNLDLDMNTPFGAVQVTSLDGASLEDAERMLLVTAARVANTGMHWSDDTRQSVSDRRGHAPTRIEPVTGRLILRGLQGAKRVLVQALNECGQPSGTAWETQPDEAGFVISLGHDTTLWYLILVVRA